MIGNVVPFGETVSARRQNGPAARCAGPLNADERELIALLRQFRPEVRRAFLALLRALAPQHGGGRA